MQTQKYYHAENAGRGLIAGAMFEIYDTLGGTHWGVYTTSKTSEIVELDKLTKDPKSAVTSITEDEYDYCKKKGSTGNSARDFLHLRPPHPVIPPSATAVTDPQIAGLGLPKNPVDTTALKGDGKAEVTETGPEEERAPEVNASFENPNAAVNVGKPNRSGKQATKPPEPPQQK